MWALLYQLHRDYSLWYKTEISTFEIFITDSADSFLFIFSTELWCDSSQIGKLLIDLSNSILYKFIGLSG